MNIIENGIYVGYSEPQNYGECYDNGKTGMFPFIDSIISKGTESGKLVGWQMTPERLFILFDFTGSSYVEKIIIETTKLSSDEKKYWGAAWYNVSYRGEADTRYYTLGRIYSNGATGVDELVINKNVRFIRLEIFRSPWRAFPMPKITLCGENNSNANIPLTEEEMKKDFLNEAVSVDEYGQAIFLDWDGKITTDQQMKNNAIREQEKYENIVVDERYDKYGGVKGYKKLKATGFFRVEKVDGVWWFVTPEGNPYVMKGIDLVCYSEMSYNSPIYKIGTQEVRGIFDKLPDKKKYETAYEEWDGYPVVNFFKMNLNRKYGEDFDSKWVDITHKRLADWGFNAASKWIKHPDIKMPYIKSLGAGGAFKKVRWLIDPYDENFAINVENSVKNILPKLKDDPYLIGYHYTNESGFDNEVFNAMLRSDENCAMKKAFVKLLNGKYSLDEINELLNESITSFEQLIFMEIPKNIFPQEIINEFIVATGKIYYKTINNAIKKYDPNHLYMGAGITPYWRSSYEWDISGLEYLDVLSFDHYTRSTDHWMERYAIHDFPMINIEFSFTASDRGLSPIFDRIYCEGQKERGQEYKAFMEYSFSLPQFIGSGFFILNDQPLSGRCNSDGSPGECHNFGLIDITDEPYWEFIDYVKETHTNIENIHANKKIV